jgi:lysine 2,3-aminomutase
VSVDGSDGPISGLLILSNITANNCRVTFCIGVRNSAWIEELMTTLDAFARRWPLDTDDLRRVSKRFPFRVTSHVLNLIRFPGDPIWRQAVPDVLEMRDQSGYDDPLAEERLSPVPNLVHRYPNRALWLVAHECAMACRFCTRKRRWRDPLPLTGEAFQSGLDYIRSHPEIQDVLLSGGDPLLLPPRRLESILAALRRIPHVEIIRIGTRVPGVLPRRITPKLIRMLSQYHPMYMNIHFNHPWEITPECRLACTLLANAGIPLGSQTVLLKGVNDNAEVLGELFQKLLSLRVRPYYLMQMDLTRGTEHFRTPIRTGLEILRALRNHVSGLALPHFVVDLPGGQGKVPLIPNSVENITEDHLTLKDYRGGLCRYPLLPGEEKDLAEWLLPSQSLTSTCKPR